jgi:hypothetical protein
MHEIAHCGRVNHALNQISRALREAPMDQMVKQKFPVSTRVASQKTLSGSVYERIVMDRLHDKGGQLSLRDFDLGPQSLEPFLLQEGVYDDIQKSKISQR